MPRKRKSEEETFEKELETAEIEDDMDDDDATLDDSDTHLDDSDTTLIELQPTPDELQKTSKRKKKNSRKIIAGDFFSDVHLVSSSSTGLFVLKMNPDGTFSLTHQEPFTPPLTKKDILLRFGPGTYKIIAKNLSKNSKLFEEIVKIHDAKMPEKQVQNPQQVFYPYPPYPAPQNGPSMNEILDKLPAIMSALAALINAFRRDKAQEAKSFVELLVEMKEKEMELEQKKLELMKEEDEEQEPEIDMQQIQQLIMSAQQGDQQSINQLQMILEYLPEEYKPIAAIISMLLNQKGGNNNEQQPK